jgi:hypothetical protein
MGPNRKIPAALHSLIPRQIKFWDVRQSAPAAVLQLSDSVFAMDAKGDYLVSSLFFSAAHLTCQRLQGPLRDCLSMMSVRDIILPGYENTTLL